jgi:hypothetical protein
MERNLNECSTLDWKQSPGKALRVSFCALIALLGVFQFSENTVDPDLWGHVVFGRQILETGAIPKVESYSWTACGQPWINHEWLSELALGAAHKWAGGGGVLLLKMAAGLLTFALCLRLGGAGLAWPARFVTWCFGALAVVEISYGFAARPQIFTALGLAVELLLLRRIHAGGRWRALALPALFVVWINMHGGALAGFGLLVLTALATSAQCFWRKIPRGAIVTLWLATGAVAAVLFCNPWGAGLLSWLIDSMLWMRPEIQEWNQTPLGWDHAAFFLLVALGIFAWCCTRRPRAWWELAACVMFAILGWRAARNAPLFALTALALIPPHLADALARFRPAFARLQAAVGTPNSQKIAASLCCCGTLCIGTGTFLLHKEHPLTMEAPRSQYPVGAVDFLREHEMRGRLLVFFDWGEMAIFQLPDCPPSIDGRLDTCYSRPLIAEHWKFYNGQTVNPNILNINESDLALLPVNLAGAVELAKRPGWRTIYYDSLAVVLARDAARFPKLQKLALPVAGSEAATAGRMPFPSR